MSTASHTIVFTAPEKFSGKGFPIWQTKMQLLLMRENILGEEGAPSDQDKNTTWKLRNQKAIVFKAYVL